MSKTKPIDPMESAMIRFALYCKTLDIEADHVLNFYNKEFELADPDAVVLNVISIRYFTGML